jgi:LPS export ABC transporter protein LptC
VIEARRVKTSISPADLERQLLFAGLTAAFVASAVQNAIDDVTTFVLILWWPMMGFMLSLAPRIKRAAPLAAALVALTVFGAGCARGVAPAPTPSTSASASANAPNISSVTAHGAGGKPITIEDIENSRPVYVLKSASVTYLPSRSQGTFSDNHLVFYKGRATRLEVSAPSAVLNLKNYDVTLRGGVRAINSNGDALDADQIQYDGRRHQLLASGNVVAVDANGTKITGDRAIADLDLQVVRIFGHINMTGQGH